MFSLMIICKSAKTPYNANKSILLVLLNLAYRWRCLSDVQYRYYVLAWCTLVFLALYLIEIIM